MGQQVAPSREELLRQFTENFSTTCIIERTWALEKLRVAYQCQTQAELVRLVQMRQSVVSRLQRYLRLAPEIQEMMQHGPGGSLGMSTQTALELVRVDHAAQRWLVANMPSYLVTDGRKKLWVWRQIEKAKKGSQVLPMVVASIPKEESESEQPEEKVVPLVVAKPPPRVLQPVVVQPRPQQPMRPVMTHRPNPGAHLKHVLPQFDLPRQAETKPPAKQEILVNAFDERRGGYSLMSLDKQRLQEFLGKKLLRFQDRGMPMPAHIREFLES